ncbi:MAG: phosphoribosylanthranilate isomerase [Deltaproteobacteria bacterium]|nr:phosphoribosylanthranilate isomerase [Deltaproteobacteria bacterium]
MRERDNIEEILQLSPDFMGFIFYRPSKRYVGDGFKLSEDKFNWGVCRRVGVFVNHELDVVRRAVDDANLHAVQLHGSEEPAYCEQLKEALPDIEIWKAFSVGPDFDLQSISLYSDVTETFLFDSPLSGFGGSGRSFDWGLISRYNDPRPFILAGGIGSGNISEALRFKRKAASLIAVDINSKAEKVPGVKSPELVSRIIEAVRR